MTSVPSVVWVGSVLILGSGMFVSGTGMVISVVGIIVLFVGTVVALVVVTVGSVTILLHAQAHREKAKAITKANIMIFFIYTLLLLISTIVFPVVL